MTQYFPWHSPESCQIPQHIQFSRQVVNLIGNITLTLFTIFSILLTWSSLLELPHSSGQLYNRSLWVVHWSSVTRTNMLCRCFKICSLQVKLKLFQSYCICITQHYGLVLQLQCIRSCHRVTPSAWSHFLVIANTEVSLQCCLNWVYLVSTYSCITQNSVLSVVFCAVVRWLSVAC